MEGRSLMVVQRCRWEFDDVTEIFRIVGKVENANSTISIRVDIVGSSPIEFAKPIGEGRKVKNGNPAIAIPIRRQLESCIYMRQIC